MFKKRQTWGLKILTFWKKKRRNDENYETIISFTKFYKKYKKRQKVSKKRVKTNKFENKFLRSRCTKRNKRGRGDLFKKRQTWGLKILTFWKKKRRNDENDETINAYKNRQQSRSQSRQQNRQQNRQQSRSQSGSQFGLAFIVTILCENCKKT